MSSGGTCHYCGKYQCVCEPVSMPNSGPTVYVPEVINLPSHDRLAMMIDTATEAYRELYAENADLRRQLAEAQATLAEAEANAAAMRADIESAIAVEWFKTHVSFTSEERMRAAMDARMAKYKDTGHRLLARLAAAEAVCEATEKLILVFQGKVDFPISETPHLPPLIAAWRKECGQ